MHSWISRFLNQPYKVHKTALYFIYWKMWQTNTVRQNKQDVALTGRNSTSPPPGEYAIPWSVTDDDRWRRQTPDSISSLAPFTICRWSSNKDSASNKNKSYKIHSINTNQWPKSTFIESFFSENFTWFLQMIKHITFLYSSFGLT